MSNIRDLIDSLHAQDTVASLQTFENIMNDKIAHVIQAKREQVGAGFFGESRSDYGTDNILELSNGKKSTMIYDHSGHPKDTVDPKDHDVTISSGLHKGTWLVRGKPENVDNYTDAHKIQKKEIANKNGFLDESVESLQEYNAQGTVNGKKFKILTDDSYDTDDVHKQNPHLSREEAKAIVDHTETDEFVDGDNHSSTQNGHKVTVNSNGGHFGEQGEFKKDFKKKVNESVDSFGKAIKKGMDERDAYDIGYEHGGLGKPHNNPHKPGSQDHTWYNDGYEQGKAENLDESVELNEAENYTHKAITKDYGKKVRGAGDPKITFSHNVYYMSDDDGHTYVKKVTQKQFHASDLTDKTEDSVKDDHVAHLLSKVPQFNKKVEYNMWAKKNNPTYEEKVKKLSESVEQLDELSKDTLKSYIKKAGPDAINRASDGAYKLANADTEDSFHNDDGSVDNGEKDDTKAVRRINGINTAVDKLTESKEIKKDDYVVHNESGAVGKVDGISGDKSSIDITWNDKDSNHDTSLPIEQVSKFKKSLDEALRLIKTHTSTDGKKVAKVYKDNDWNEHRVKHFVDGKHETEADYHTDDVEDAHDTAKAWLSGKYK